MVSMGNIASGVAGGATVAIVIKAIDQFSKTFSSVNKQLIGMGTAITGFGVIGAGVIGTLTNEASKGLPIMDAFFRMMGENGPAMLKKLQGATKGTVSDIDLMTAANQALLLGIDPDLLPAMFEGAAAVSQATGKPISEAINDITLGIGRQSKMILDNLGIIIDVEKANKIYAESLGKTSAELTDAEKKIAFTNATMEALIVNTEKVGPLQDSAAVSAQQMAASFANVKQKLGEQLMPVMIFFLDKIIKPVIGFFEKHPKITKWAGIIGVAATAVALLVGPLLILIGMFPAILAGISSVGTALLFLVANPIGIAILAIGALIIAGIFLMRHWDKVKIAVSNLGIFISNVFKGMANVVITVWNKIVETIERRINRVISAINTLIRGLNKVPGVNISRFSKINLGKFEADLFKLQDFQSFKNPDSPLQPVGGTTVNINNLNGFNSEDIAKELEKELENVISLG